MLILRYHSVAETFALFLHLHDVDAGTPKIFRRRYLLKLAFHNLSRFLLILILQIFALKRKRLTLLHNFILLLLCLRK